MNILLRFPCVICCFLFYVCFFGLNLLILTKFFNNNMVFETNAKVLFVSKKFEHHVLTTKEIYSRKYYYYRRDLSETHQRLTCLIEDRHASSGTHQKAKFLIGDPLETDMLHRRPKCLIGDKFETDILQGHQETHQSLLVCLIRDLTLFHYEQ